MAGRNKWSRVSILTALLNEVDTLIKDNPQLGYPSASSFVNDAVRRLLEKSRKRTEEDKVGNCKTACTPTETIVGSQQILKTFLREMVLATAGELRVEIDPKKLDKIVKVIAQKLTHNEG